MYYKRNQTPDKIPLPPAGRNMSLSPGNRGTKTPRPLRRGAVRGASPSADCRTSPALRRKINPIKRNWIMERVMYLSLIFLVLFICSDNLVAGNSTPVDTLMDIELNGVRQKVLIKSNDLNNPVLLWLHGGPGTSEMFITHHCMDNLINFFTIVHWGQRGTALSYNDRIRSTDVSFDKIFHDAIRLTEILRTTYRQEKIFLIGHSFGSILGIHLIEKYPDRYYAYVGIGQVINDRKSREITYKWLINKLQEDSDTLEIARISRNRNIPMELITRYKGNFYNGKTLFDVIIESPYYYEGYLDNYSKSMNFVREAVRRNPSTLEKDILNDIDKLEVPVYFFEGRHDRIPACAPELVVEYITKLNAPKKEIIWFEESAHHPNIDEPDKFQKTLIDKVLNENYTRN
jgi:pimeloyl-ACP methyl ester carboxylesterase